MFDPHTIQNDFPILNKKIHGKKLVYLDNAATSQKPDSVINTISHYYKHNNANIHRGVHQLSEESTNIWEQSRQTIAQFFGTTLEELIITRNATEAINGIVYGWALHHIKQGNVILTTEMEHHANIVPWQELCQQTGANLEFVQITDDGRLDLEDLKSKCQNPQVKCLALCHVSNTLGTVNPISTIVEIIKKYNPKSKIIIDGAQSAPHMKIDFSKLGVDFYAFSGHKMLGPMGVGGLLVRKSLLQSDEIKPWYFGGGMIQSVSKENTEYATSLIDRFTPGTPDVASVAGLASACTYLQKLDLNEVEKHDRELVAYALEQLRSLQNIQVVGPTSNRLGSVAFIHTKVHAHDVAQVLDSEGIAVRSGHHCCMPLHEKLTLSGTVRASFQIYNTKQHIDQLVKGLTKVEEVFGV